VVTRVMDLTGARPRTRIDVVPSICVELLMSVAKFGMEGSRETFEDGVTWFDQVRTTASPQLLADLQGIGAKEGAGWGNLAAVALGLSTDAPPFPSVPEFLAHLEAMAPRDLWLIMVGYHFPPLRQEIGVETFRKAAEGNDPARRAIARADRKWGNDLDEQPPFLHMSPRKTKSSILSVLRRWHTEIFLATEDEVRSTLERDARAKRALASTLTPENLVEVATNGLEFRAEPWTRAAVLVPHVVMRPWNAMGEWEDHAIICYPVADESLGADPGEPSPRMVRLYKALSDEKRLRILKRLVTGKATLQELADSVGLAKSSAHHHMVILRSAGLVTVTGDSRRLYTLRPDTIPEASGLLESFLKERSR
jgi:DNA-binding transcriptional ArsR family regulator